MRYVVITEKTQYGFYFKVMDTLENVQVGQSFFSRTKAEIEADKLNFGATDMFSMLDIGATVKLGVLPAGHIVTDKEVRAIIESGKRLVSRPERQVSYETV
jgi:hypothetical protein